MAEVLDLTTSDCEDNVSSSSNAVAPVKNESQPRSRSRSRSVRPQFSNNEDAPQVTIVNGIGFWKSWTRSFKTTLLKLLDLIDNSVDGATIQEAPGFTATGRIHIYPDVYEQSKTNRMGKKFTSTTGLCIRNNSPHKIVPLAEALVVHNTTKIDAGEIGENGVGLKQACAALCDLSFVLVKNGSNANIELGIVAKSLQREEGPYLPAFQFSNKKGEGERPLREQMVSLFGEPRHADVAKCIAKWGADISGGEPSLATGIDGLCQRFDDICHNFYGNKYVFEVILNDIRHDQDEGLAGRALYAQQKITVNHLIKDLQREIPRTYLHIPDSFEFIVGKKKLAFRYWQERLVEFTTFTVTVGATIPWKQNFEVSDEHPDSYDLRLFLGFDRFRIVESDFEPTTGEKRETKNASLYFYSRQSGRLIKSEQDARHMLGLNAGSSLYASALTIIIDDIGGNLPLHPTKQDLAFGNENKGAVHEDNLFAWVGAVTKFYYNQNLKKFNNQKKALSANVSKYVDYEIPQELKAYSKSEFTTFELTFEQSRNTIRVDNKLAKEIVGSDTFFRLFPRPGAEASKGKGKKRSRSDKQRRKPKKKSEQQSLTCDAEKEVTELSRTQPISYQEESDSSAEASEGEGKKRSRSSVQKRQATGAEKEVIKRAMTKPVSHREESDSDAEASEGEEKKRSRSSMQKRHYAQKELINRSRSKPVVYWEESGDSDSESESSVKMEDATVNNVNNEAGCIDLCESSDEDGEGAVGYPVPNDAGDHSSKVSQVCDASNDGSQTDASSKSKSVASHLDSTKQNKIRELQLVMKELRNESDSRIKSLQNENKALRESIAAASRSDMTETNKTHELEAVIKQPRNESNSKIRALENDNKALKEELDQKEKVIEVLKRRLGMGGKRR